MIKSERGSEKNCRKVREGDEEKGEKREDRKRSQGVKKLCKWRRVVKCVSVPRKGKIVNVIQSVTQG